VPPSQTVIIPPEERSGPRRITVNPEYTQWYHQDQMISSALNSSLEEEALGHVVTTSGDVWCILQNNFASSSRTRIMQIRMQLATMQKKDLSIADYYSKMKRLADTLSAISKPLQDE
jgi:RNA-binding protein YlmH